jgi:hypothetical protein
VKSELALCIEAQHAGPYSLTTTSIEPHFKGKGKEKTEEGKGKERKKEGRKERGQELWLLM